MLFLNTKYALNFETKNCFGMMKSDVINKHLKQVFDSSRYIIHTFKRYSWEGVLVIDLESKSLVSITSNSNLNHVPKVKERSIPHYMQTLLHCLNARVDANQQITFEGFESFEDEVYEDDFAKIINGLDLDFNDFTYYIVAYDFKSNKVTDMSWYLLGPDFNIAEKTNMMELVKPDFIELTASDDLEIGNDNSTEKQPQPRKGIPLGLKENKLKKEG